MSTIQPTEEMVEDVAVVYFQELEVPSRQGMEIDDLGERAGASQCILHGRVSTALHRLNPALPHEVCEEVIRNLSRLPHPTLIQNNRWFHMLLTDGVEVEYRDPRPVRPAAGARG